MGPLRSGWGGLSSSYAERGLKDCIRTSSQRLHICLNQVKLLGWGLANSMQDGDLAKFTFLVHEESVHALPLLNGDRR